MNQNDRIRWIDMIDPIYTLARLVDIDPTELKITGIWVMDNFLTIYYNDEKNTPRFKTARYDLS